MVDRKETADCYEACLRNADEHRTNSLKHLYWLDRAAKYTKAMEADTLRRAVKDARIKAEQAAAEKAAAEKRTRRRRLEASAAAAQMERWERTRGPAVLKPVPAV